MASRDLISVTGTSSAEKMVAYSTPITPPPITVKVRGRCSRLRISSLSRTRLPSNGTLCGRCGCVPEGNQRVLERRLAYFARIGGELHRASGREISRTANRLAHRVAHELVLQHLDFVIELSSASVRQDRPGRNRLLHAIATAIEFALAPARLRFSTVSRSVFEGIVPVCTETPPSRFARDPPPAPTYRAWPTAPPHAAPPARCRSPACRWLLPISLPFADSAR